MADTIETGELAQYFAQTASLFDTLGELMYSELSQEAIEALAKQDFQAQASGMPEGVLADGFRGLGRYLARRGPNVRQDLAVEYARIFLGAGVDSERLATPFESVFTSAEGLLMQEARDEVVAIYRSQGFAVDRSLNVPEDHLAFELQFLGRLCEVVAEKVGAGKDCNDVLQVQADFIDDHILNWIDALSQRVEACALSGFYPSVMKIIKGCVLENRASVGELLGESAC